MSECGYCSARWVTSNILACPNCGWQPKTPDLNTAASSFQAEKHDKDCRYCSSSFVTREGREIHENLKHSIFEPRDMKATIERGEWTPEKKPADPDSADHAPRCGIIGTPQYEWACTCKPDRTSGEQK